MTSGPFNKLRDFEVNQKIADLQHYNNLNLSQSHFCVKFTQIKSRDLFWLSMANTFFDFFFDVYESLPFPLENQTVLSQ